VLHSPLVNNNRLTLEARMILHGGLTLEKRHFSLVVPEDLAEWLDKEAAKQSRTRNNLINCILQQYCKKTKQVAMQEVNTQQ